MINLSVQAGKVKRSSEPLATLASYRRTKVFKTILNSSILFLCIGNLTLIIFVRGFLPLQGKITFGILLRYEEKESETWLRVGEEILPNAD